MSCNHSIQKFTHLFSLLPLTTFVVGLGLPNFFVLISNSLIARVMFISYFADISRNKTWCFSANCHASSVFTCLSFSSSHLLPKIAMGQYSLFLLIALIHNPNSAKALASSIE